MIDILKYRQLNQHRIETIQAAALDIVKVALGEPDAMEDKEMRAMNLANQTLIVDALNDLISFFLDIEEEEQRKEKEKLN